MAKAQILIVEDDGILALDLRNRLVGLGFGVSASVPSGEEAIEKVKSSPPDLVLMDIMLKGAMNGIEAAARINSKFDIPIVYLTAYAEEKLLEQAKLTQPYGYILKPFEDRDLNAALKIALYKHKADRTLRASEQCYRSMMDVMDDAMYICSSDFRIEFMNPAMIKRTGRDATGEACFKVLHARETKCPWCVWRKVLQGEHVNYELVSPKDSRHYHVANSPIRHADGSISKHAVFRDFTEIKAMEQHLQRAQKMESVGVLAGGIAHEFNSLLATMLGYGEMLRVDIPEGSRPREYLEGVMEACYRSTDLVRQLLDFARTPEAGRKPVRLAPIVEESIQTLQSYLPANIHVHRNIEAASGNILADSGKIKQVIMNLGINAGDAIGENNGEIGVHLSEVEVDDETASREGVRSGTYLKLMVSDTGCGMSLKVLARIYEPFFTTKDVGRGTGLGLAVVHGIVKSHEGFITADSEPEKGSRFEVYLPVVEN